jgi:tetratricopeptide (TPR) repeat protein
VNIKEILKYGIWVGLGLVLIVPFIVADSMFFPFIVGKAFIFRIIVEIIFGLWLILIIKDKEFRPKWSWVLGAVALLTFILLIADINAVAPYKAFWSNFERMEGWVTFIHLLAYFTVLGSILNTEKLWLWFLRANLVAGTIMALTSIDKATEVRFSGPLGNPIYISVYFLFIFFFAVILLYKDTLVKNLTDWNLFKKVFANILFYVYLAVSILSLYVVYRTSRGALLGAIGGIFIAMILIAIFEKEKKVIKHIAIGGVVAVIVVVVLFLGARDTQYVKNNPTLSRLAEVSWSNVNGQARQLIWPIALKGYKEKPILGWGQEGFNYVFNKYYDPKLYNQESWFDRAHNAPLDFLVAGGILGFLSYLALFGSALYLLWLRRNNLSMAERSLLTGLFAGYLFQAIFVFDNLVSYIMFFTALAYVHSRVTEAEENKPAFKFMADFISNEEYQNYILIPVVILLTIAGVYFVNVPGIKANKTLIQSLRLIQGSQVVPAIESFKLALSYKSMGDSEIREQLLSYAPSVLKTNELDMNIRKDFLSLTVTEVEKQIAIVPNDARYHILMASLLNNIGNPEAALKYVNKAIELSPQKQAMRFELIQSLYMLGRKDEALAEAQKAYDLDRNYDQAKSIYDTLLKETGGKAN